MKTKLLILALGLYLFQFCTESNTDPPPMEDTSVLISQTDKEGTPVSQDDTADTEENIEGADAAEIEEQVETVIDVSKTIIGAGQEMLETKRRNDSIKMSKREKMFAYQLGLPLKNEKLAIEAYEKLSDNEGVCVLKKSRREYLLVKYGSGDEAEIEAGLEDYRAQHASEVIGEIKKIDLVRECGKRKKPVRSRHIKRWNKDTQIDCLICK